MPAPIHTYIVRTQSQPVRRSWSFFRHCFSSLNPSAKTTWSSVATAAPTAKSLGSQSTARTTIRMLFLARFALSSLLRGLAHELCQSRISVVDFTVGLSLLMTQSIIVSYRVCCMMPYDEIGYLFITCLTASRPKCMYMRCKQLFQKEQLEFHYATNFQYWFSR